MLSIAPKRKNESTKTHPFNIIWKGISSIAYMKSFANANVSLIGIKYVCVHKIHTIDNTLIPLIQSNELLCVVVSNRILPLEYNENDFKVSSIKCLRSKIAKLK